MITWLNKYPSRNLVGKPEHKTPLQILDVDWRTLLPWTFKKEAEIVDWIK
jgi:hypothetical protein